MKPVTQNLELSGKSISPGLAIGEAFVHKDIVHRDHDLYDISSDEVHEELERIKEAISEACQDLEVCANRVEQSLDKAAADTFRAQKAMIRDSTFLSDIETELRGELINAEQAVKNVLRRLERGFEQSDSEVFKQRSDDLKDLARRLLRALAGVKAHSLEGLPPNSVLVAQRLLPSDTVFLSRKSTVAIVVEHGGLASHAALLTREMGIPAVTGIARLVEKIVTGDRLLIDGDRGAITVNPDSEVQSDFVERMKHKSHSFADICNRCNEPAETIDGHLIEVMANIGCFEDAQLAKKNGADGIGLFRLEQLYLSCKAPPTRRELLNAVQPCVELFADKPVVIRLLDAGADKDVPFLNLPTEDNPSLGRRGVRLLLEYPDLATSQIEALVELAQDHDIRILVPMVTLSSDVVRIRGLMNQVAERMRVPKAPKLGAMIETPAAALCAGDIARTSDFLSVGTNDLTQYAMAAGRENPLVDDYFVEEHPAVMRLVGIALEEAQDTPLATCGELAGDVDAVPHLLELGIRTLSVAPSLVPVVKETVRGVKISSSEQSIESLQEQVKL
jgi:phosphotransferase system enzyme I (PtsI)